MNEKEVNLIIGSLLHDVGKIIYRSGDGRNHSRSGTDFIKDNVGIGDKDILECILFHHKKNLLNASINKDSNAYITYIADNMASATDRRGNEKEDYGFEMTMPLSSVFNILNENNQDYTYSAKMLDLEKEINYPGEYNQKFESSFYLSVVNQIKNNLVEYENTREYVNSLLEVLEGTCTFIPSSTNKNELADISLYDHVKMTAAFSSCIYKYIKEYQVEDYKELLFDNEKEFFNRKAFLLYSVDLSGIQDFIYTITSKEALKMLRSRSFYLEIFMEHLIDELLEKLEMSRSNLIYSGGGHCYIILPNTNTCKNIIIEHENSINEWLKDKFDNALYMASGYSECSANELQNIPQGSYSQIYRSISEMISNKKSHKYSGKDIIKFNNKNMDHYDRECAICKRIGKINEKGECVYCHDIKKMSKAILYSEFFVITSEKTKDCMELPNERYLVACDKNTLLEMLKNNNSVVRTYSINGQYKGKKLSKNLWVGNYTAGASFDELAGASEGIKRIAVFRADVDNLGSAFVNGFKQKDGKYETISRTATLSRHLSFFFKHHINTILKNPEYTMTGNGPVRNISIIYSGGDDIFVVGAWNDVIEFSIDLSEKFKKYTQNKLTLSGGIALYRSGYPVSVMAVESGALEDNSKEKFNKQGKDAITIFDKNFSFKWNTFENKILNEKLIAITNFFNGNNEYGKNFLYNILELIRGQEENENKGIKDQINFARYVYILSRMEPDKDADEILKEKYKIFSSKMYEWMKKKENRPELILAIYIYVYLIRQEDENNDN